MLASGPGETNAGLGELGFLSALPSTVTLRFHHLVLGSSRVTRPVLSSRS